MGNSNSKRAVRADMVLYQSIRAYVLEHGYAPSVREMAKMIGKSVGVTHARLLKLMDDGYIETDLDDLSAPRAIRVKGLKVVEEE